MILFRVRCLLFCGFYSAFFQQCTHIPLSPARSAFFFLLTKLQMGLAYLKFLYLPYFDAWEVKRKKERLLLGNVPFSFRRHRPKIFNQHLFIRARNAGRPYTAAEMRKALSDIRAEIIRVSEKLEGWRIGDARISRGSISLKSTVL